MNHAKGAHSNELAFLKIEYPWLSNYDNLYGTAFALKKESSLIEFKNHEKKW
ncbi:hypothetical protein kam1_452 [Methylacidiphilum kamchatkense Kam1]|uniref:Uncharacterized protein n=1 Tax=Methylacidiphilum kamchatkense Kam1 TaxID=1202785 RepID=A0A516TKD8_9BACT|nr:hypothetical protein kam1_452 [Methylacidiphilum kamchatkense Kam1]